MNKYAVSILVTSGQSFQLMLVVLTAFSKDEVIGKGHRVAKIKRPGWNVVEIMAVDVDTPAYHL